MKLKNPKPLYIALSLFFLKTIPTIILGLYLKQHLQVPHLALNHQLNLLMKKNK